MRMSTAILQVQILEQMAPQVRDRLSAKESVIKISGAIGLIIYILKKYKCSSMKGVCNVDNQLDIQKCI